MIGNNELLYPWFMTLPGKDLMMTYVICRFALIFDIDWDVLCSLSCTDLRFFSSDIRQGLLGVGLLTKDTGQLNYQLDKGQYAMK